MKCVRLYLVLIIFLLLFENARADLVFFSIATNGIISVVRDGLLLAGLAWVLVRGMNLSAMDFVYFGLAISATAILAIMFSTGNVSFSEFHGIYTYLRAFSFFIVFNSLITQKNYVFVRLVLIVSVAVTASSVLLIYGYQPSWIIRDQGARVSVGNSSIHSATMFISMVLAYFSAWTSSRLLKLLTVAIFFIGGLLTSTATWFVLAFISVLILVANAFISSVGAVPKLRKGMIFLFAAFVVALLTLQPVVISSTRFQPYILNMNIKLQQAILALFNSDGTNVGTLSIRQAQFDVVLPHMRALGMIWGLGPFGHLHYTQLMENQYYALFLNFGLIGLLSFMILLFRRSIYLSIRSHPSIRIPLLLIWIAFLTYSWTLETFMCVQIIGIFALIDTLIRRSSEFGSGCVAKSKS